MTEPTTRYNGMNGTRRWIFGIVAGLVITIGGYGFVRAITAVSATEFKKQDNRIDSLETQQAVTNAKLDTIIEDVGEVKELIKDLQDDVKSINKKP